jgi:nicotinic acid mononucleotide adenylyltransferase
MDNKYGIYWGTFDPATLAHRHVMLTAIEELKLNKLIVVVNNDAKTKKNYNIPVKYRMAMIHSMIPPMYKTKIIVICQTDEVQHSVENIKKTLYETDRVYPIVGEDSCRKGAAYLHYNKYVAMMPRTDDGAEKLLDINALLAHHAPKTQLLTLTPKEMFKGTSSTKVRAAYTCGEKDQAEASLQQKVYDTINRLCLLSPEERERKVQTEFFARWQAYVKKQSDRIS